MTKQKVFVQIKSRGDESKWKAFLKQYFPNCHASKLLEEDLVIDVVLRQSGRCYENKSIAVTPDGYGKITFRFAAAGHYKEVENFEEFKLTKCYKDIVKQGPNVDPSEVKIINIKKL